MVAIQGVVIQVVAIQLAVIRLSAIDHTQVVEQLRKAHLLDVMKHPTAEAPATSVDSKDIDRTRAWVIVTAVWKENLKDDSRIHSADAYATALTDLTHSAGAARVGAIFALIAVLFIVCVGGLHPSCSSKTWAIVVGLGLFVLHYWNYRCTGELTERFINEVLSDALSNRKSPSSSQQPTVTFVDL